MSTATALAPETPAATAPVQERQSQESAILAAYHQTERNGLEFGRLCYEYGERYGAQGSANSGLAQFLRKSGIKEGRAYYWVAEYKASIKLGIPCLACDETFPSKTKLKKHINKNHPETLAPMRESHNETSESEPSESEPSDSEPSKQSQSISEPVKPDTSEKVVVEEGKVFGNLIAHKCVARAPYDGSKIWLVENQKTGKAELWRACDLTRIERKGERRNNARHYGHQARSSVFQLNNGFGKMTAAAQDALADIKAGKFDLDGFEDKLIAIWDAETQHPEALESIEITPQSQAQSQSETIARLELELAEAKTELAGVKTELAEAKAEIERLKASSATRTTVAVGDEITVPITVFDNNDDEEGHDVPMKFRIDDLPASEDEFFRTKSPMERGKTFARVTLELVEDDRVLKKKIERPDKPKARRANKVRRVVSIRS